MLPGSSRRYRDSGSRTSYWTRYYRVSEDYLLAGQYLVSLQRAMTVWKYQGLPALVQAFDARAWFAAQTGSEHYLTAAAVPSQDVVAAATASSNGVVATGIWRPPTLPLGRCSPY